MPALLTMRDLEAVAEGNWLLRGVSLEVEEGSTVAVVGGAAAGKSLLLELVMGLRPLRAGQIRLSGRDLTSLGSIERQRLGLRCAFQAPPVFPGLSVAELLALAAPSVRLDGSAFARIAAYLPELEDHLDQPIDGLELPLLRLVDLGRALLGLPRLLLIDMLLPAVGVDRAGELLHALSRDGYTLLVADRYAEVLLGHADYGYVLAQGRVVAKGRPAELTADPRLLAACAGDPGAYD
jgi:branched-chain amino acid transport system ATP-binding protein